MKNTPNFYFQVLSLYAFLLIIFGNTLQAQCPNGQGEPDWLEPVPNPFGLSAPMGEDTLNWIKLVDIDNDDTLEAFIFSQRTSSPDWEDLTYFENTGSNAEPQFELQGSYPFNIPQNNPNWLWQLVDINGDNLKDYIAYGFLFDNPLTVIFNEGGTAAESDFSGGFTYNPFGVGLPMAGGETWDAVNPTFVDIDDNGSLDLFYGGFFNGEPGLNSFYFSENTSADPTNPEYDDLQMNPFGLSFPPGFNLHFVTFGDVDCDDDLDMYFIGRTSQTHFFFFENIGTAASPDFSGGYQNAKAHGANGGLIDIHGDGDLDMITNLDGHGVWYYENPIVTVSTNELQLDATLELNPNPASDLLNFELESYENLDQLDLEIFNMVGQKMTALSFQSFNNSLQKTISLEGLPSGIYILKVNSKGKFLIRKFLKL